MKAKRILAVLLSTAVLSASMTVGAALTAAADTSAAPAIGEIAKPEFVPVQEVSILSRAEGTTILPNKADFGRLGTQHKYNADDMTMVLEDIRFAADADADAGVAVGLVPGFGGWYDSNSLFMVFTKGGAVKLARSWEYGNKTFYKTETGFDFSSGRIEFSLKLDGETYTLTANGKAFTFPKSDLAEQSGLDMTAAYIAFGTMGNVEAFRVASITGGEAGSAGGEFPVKTVEYSPTPDDQLKPPADGEIVKGDFPGVDATVTGNKVELKAGRVGSKSTYNMNNAKIVITDIVYSDASTEPTSKLQVAFASASAAWFDDAALIFSFGRDGSVDVIKGRGVGGADPYKSFKNVYDFNDNRIELSVKLEGDNYVVTVNSGSFVLAKAELEELFAPAEAGQKAPLDPENAYFSFNKDGSPATFTVASIESEKETVEFTPTPADQLKNPPAEGEIHNLWGVPNVTVGEATKTGTKLTFATGATAAGTRVGTKDTYNLDQMRVVINGIEGETGVRIVMSCEDNGWTDKYGVMVSINPDNTLSVSKYYSNKGGAEVLTNVPMNTQIDGVVEMTFRLIGEDYVLTVNGQEFKIAKEQFADIFTDTGLQYDAAYLVFGIAVDGAASYNVADITGGKDDVPADQDPDNPGSTQTGVGALPAALAVVAVFASAALAAVTLKKRNNA